MPLTSDPHTSAHPPESRAAVLGLLARSPSEELDARITALGELPRFEWLRRPETGMVMVRARTGGNGAQFNLGEATLTRCALRLADGPIGIGYVRGANARHAECIALCDALLQLPARRARIEDEVLAPLARAEAARRHARSAAAASSKVDFFTLVRGEDK